jgi:hypothetical protein
MRFALAPDKGGRQSRVSRQIPVMSLKNNDPEGATSIEMTPRSCV